MKELTAIDGQNAVLGGGVFAAGGGGWLHHGELMANVATSVGTPVLAGIDELPPDSWVATVTAIGAPAAKDWEIRPLDYVRAFELLRERSPHPISAVMTAQNGYSTSVNGWIQSSVLGVKVLDAAGDIRAHPTGKLGALGLTSRPGYESVQAVAGGNRALYRYYESVHVGSVVTCDDVLRDISVRVGGFIASARNPVELSWVRENAALGSVTRAIELGAAMRQAQVDGVEAVLEAILESIGARVLSRGVLSHEVQLETHGGWDRGVFRVGDCTIPYLNEFMAADIDGQRVASYPDMIGVIRMDSGLPLAVKDASPGIPVAVIAVAARDLPLSTSACDPIGIREVEEIMSLSLLDYLSPAQAS